ncbi:MAG: riboflavin synthase [Actinomycetota bacterium]|nr:riboflavin synthase [Actinomycetota bacterium]
MFTGLVEELGVVEGIEDQGDAVRLVVRGQHVLADVVLGDSIAVNGCCLTVAERELETFTADVMRETLEKTSLGLLEPGSKVNLERAVTATTRLGGHIVQGHVDGTGTVHSRSSSEHWELVKISLPPHLARYLVPKGSVTVDGISLTVVDVEDGTQPVFTVSLIPETLARTTLGSKQDGDLVNLEVDVIAKYVERLLAFGDDRDDTEDNDTEDD